MEADKRTFSVGHWNVEGMGDMAIIGKDVGLGRRRILGCRYSLAVAGMDSGDDRV